MRVAILAHLLDFRAGYRQAGVSRYTEQLIRALPVVAPSDTYLAYAGTGATDGAPARRATGVDWRLSRLPTQSPMVRIAWEQAAGPLVLARDGADVVHAPVNVTPLLARVPSVVTVHDLAFRVYPEQYPGLKQRYLNLLTGLSVRRAARVIAVSESTRDDLLRFYRVRREQIVVIPNGLDPDMTPANPVSELPRFRQQHGLPEQFVLFVGTLQPRKNLVALLRAWSGLDSDFRLPLVVVGATGWQYEPIFEEARRLGVAGDVQFKGYSDADQLRLWYSAATAFVYPSLYEGFGLPVIEAMACGTPVITSSTSSLPEVAGDAALLVDPHDVDDLRSALNRVIREPELREGLRERGLVRASQFSWTRTALETSEIYHQAATGRRSQTVTPG